MTQWHTVRFVDEPLPHIASRAIMEWWPDYRGRPIEIGKMYKRNEVMSTSHAICDCEQFFVVRGCVGLAEDGSKLSDVGLVCRRMLEMD